jgi:hypothetical protein
VDIDSGQAPNPPMCPGYASTSATTTPFSPTYASAHTPRPALGVMVTHAGRPAYGPRTRLASPAGRT